MNNNNFNWVNFYMEFADKLMSYKNDRDALIQKIKNAYDGINPKLPTLERDNNIIDIDPFTVFGLFNKGLTDVNRIEILKAFAKEFNIKSTVPSSFNGIPVLNNQLATFYWFAGSRGESDIQNLWDIFESAIKYSKKNSIRNKNKLIESFNKVIVQKGIKWNLTMGLYWIRPYDFISLDSRNRWYICNSGKSLKTLVESFAGFKNMPNGEEYLDIIETCKEVLSNEGYKDNDFPAFSYDAWLESERVNEENRKKKKEKVDLSDDAEWFPNDYTPGISVDDWITLLNDPEVFSPSSLEIMKRMKDIGGIATCKQLSQKYGESVNFYISGSAYLGKRIFEKTNCLIVKRGEKKNKYWPILYLGRDNDGAENDGVFMWKLRSELSEALDKVDLSNVSLHAPLKKKDGATPWFWKISHGRTASTGISSEWKADCERRQVITMNRYTNGLSGSLITQGDWFLYSMRKGDFAYLCYGSEIKYLVQIIDDEPAQGQFSDEWYERSYRIVKKSENSQYPSDAIRKAWTPNHNSTLVSIDALDFPEFDELILKPHFETSTAEIIENAKCRPDKKFWFLMGNPKMWDMENLPVGEVRDYTIFNENGNARREYSAFIGCREGDVLIGYTGSPKKHICAIFECVTGVNKKRIYFKKIISLENVICREDIINDNILVEMAAMKSPQGSLFPVTKEQFKRFIELARERNSDIDFTDFDAQEAQGDDMQNSKYTRDDFLREVYISSEKYDSLVRLLKRKKNVILQGAPGVGKTYIAKRLAYSMMAERDESCIEMVQFHQSYSYDDFVRGYKPNETSFEIKDGIFYLFCKKALENPTKDYFFIIDEINRGNLSKIFGELLMLIECVHRGESLKLSVGGEDFKVPENVYIIGMMNTADRSLALIDYALRRRFGFVEIEPGFKSVGFKKVCEKFGNQKLDALIQLVEKLNSKIEKDSSLGKGFCIGHSYFCFNDTPCTDESLSCIVKHDILPMLNEYWFDDRDSYEEWEREFAKWEENLKVESE